MFYENLNKSNKIFYSEFISSLKKINKKGTYILGPNVNKFENNFSKFLGVNYCVSVANGLDALTMSLKSLNLPNNSEVLVASNPYTAPLLGEITDNLNTVAPPT